MSNFFKIIGRTFIVIFICVAALAGLFLSGIVELPIAVDTTKNASTEYISASVNKESSTPSTSSNGGKTITLSSNNSSSSTTADSVKTPLNIKLTGDYLKAFNNTVKKLSSSEVKNNLIVKIGLQILQSKTISYENALHFYSLSYTNSAGTPKAKTYSLKDTINRINAGKTIYTDCFGFARLTYCIAAYQINPSNPGSVSGLKNMYGWTGGYGDGQSYSSLSSLKGGTMLYDRLTGSNGDRHVAMFLFNSGNDVTYMDQSGIHTGTFKGTYIHATKGGNPYKFNKMRNFV